MLNTFFKISLSITQFFALLLLTFYLPLAALVYAGTHWYSFNCQFHQRCETFGEDKIAKASIEITQFFRHETKDLQGVWTQKERQHLQEVRTMYDILFISALFAIVILLLDLQAVRISRFALINLGIFLLFTLIIPFFSFFWKEVFHPLFFDNNLWYNTKAETSYYLMPNLFFRNSIIVILTITLLENIILFFMLRKN